MLFSKISKKLINSDCHILITGETGVGKTVIARKIHERSSRKGNFIVVDLATIPETLFESCLFGHIKGAFTGAFQDQIGAVEEVGAGTLFLDELGELSLIQQQKLLRFLDERKYQKVGINRSQIFKGRIILATNKNLQRMVSEGKFRKDLYYRVCNIEMKINEVDENVEFKKRIIYWMARKSGMGINESKIVMKILKDKKMPGNLREIRGHIERFLLLDELDFRENEAVIQYNTFRQMVNDFEKKLLTEKLAENNWNISKTCREISLSKSVFMEKKRRYNIQKNIKVSINDF